MGGKLHPQRLVSGDVNISRPYYGLPWPSTLQNVKVVKDYSAIHTYGKDPLAGLGELILAEAQFQSRQARR